MTASLPLAMDPSATMRCEHYRCTMAARVCVQRQMERRKPSPMAKDQTPKPALGREYCGSGTCEQGAQVRQALAGWIPPAPTDTRAAATAAGLALVAEIEQRLEAPPAPLETTMPMPSKLDTKTDDEVKAAVAEATGIAGAAKALGCTPPKLKRRLEAMNGGKPERAVRKAPKAKPVEEPAPVKQLPEDGLVEQMLRARLAYLQAQAAKVERALAALEAA